MRSIVWLGWDGNWCSRGVGWCVWEFFVLVVVVVKRWCLMQWGVLDPLLVRSIRRCRGWLVCVFFDEELVVVMCQVVLDVVMVSHRWLVCVDVVNVVGVLVECDWSVWGLLWHRWAWTYQWSVVVDSASVVVVHRRVNLSNRWWSCSVCWVWWWGRVMWSRPLDPKGWQTLHWTRTTDDV